MPKEPDQLVSQQEFADLVWTVQTLGNGQGTCNVPPKIYPADPTNNTRRTMTLIPKDIPLGSLPQYILVTDTDFTLPEGGQVRTFRVASINPDNPTA